VTFFFEVLFTFFLSLIPAWSDEYENNNPIIQIPNEPSIDQNQNNNNNLNPNEENQHHDNIANHEQNFNNQNIMNGFVNEENKGNLNLSILIF